MQVISAIPQTLIIKERMKCIDKTTLLSKNEFQLSPDTTCTINSVKLKNRDYYCLLINKDKQVLKAKVKWERDLLPDRVQIDSYFSRVKYISRENKLGEFYFKLLHRIVVTKRELHLFGIENDMLCIYCQENDSIIPTFSNCHWSKEFFLEVIKWFNSLTPEPRVTARTRLYCLKKLQLS